MLSSVPLKHAANKEFTRARQRCSVSEFSHGLSAQLLFAKDLVNGEGAKSRETCRDDFGNVGAPTWLRHACLWVLLELSNA